MAADIKSGSKVRNIRRKWQRILKNYVGGRTQVQALPKQWSRFKASLGNLKPSLQRKFKRGLGVEFTGGLVAECLPSNARP